MAPIGIGLIGLGRHGMRYVQHLKELGRDAKLVAVSRRNTQQGIALAAEQRVRFYQDYRALIADDDVGAVIVVTPSSLTSSICMEAVRAKKPLLIEKPLACTGPVAKRMAEAAELAGVPLMTAQTLRFDSAIQALKTEISKAMPARYITLTYRLERTSQARNHPPQSQQRGILLEIGTHLFDLVRFLTGHEVLEVRCETDHREEVSESSAFLALRTTGNLPCLVDVSRVSAGRVSRVEWIGEDVQISADWVRHRLSRQGSQSLNEWSVTPCHTVLETIRAFVAALQGGTPMPITGWDGYRAVAIADACYESAATGKIVRVTR